VSCPCGRVEQPSANATTCYDCGRRVSKPQPVRVAAFDPADYVPETLKPSTAWAKEGPEERPRNGSEGAQAIVDSLFTLLDAMALENSKAKRVRLGFSAYIAVRDCNNISPLEGDTSFEIAGIRFIWSSDLGAWGVEVRND
jgi:hypothetical protein